jgi:hypothetical protein
MHLVMTSITTINPDSETVSKEVKAIKLADNLAVIKSGDFFALTHTRTGRKIYESDSPGAVLDFFNLVKNFDWNYEDPKSMSDDLIAFFREMQAQTEEFSVLIRKI